MTDTTNPADEGFADTEEVVDDQEGDQVNDQADDSDEDQGDEAEGDEDEGSQEDDDTEEVEHGGEKYRIPKALKPALMMEADYRRKTQELAEQRRAHEAEVAAFKGVEKELDETRFEMASVQRRQADLEALTDAHWQQIRELDHRDGTNNYDRLQREYLALPRKMGELENTLKAKEGEAVGKQREILAKQAEEGHAILARDIPGWGPDLGAKLTEFVNAEFGMTPEKHGAAFMDPALIKLAYAAYEAKDAQRKAKVQARAVEAVKVKPAQQVKAGSAPKTGLSDRMSTEEWVRQRERQLAQSGKA